MKWMFIIFIINYFMLNKVWQQSSNEQIISKSNSATLLNNNNNNNLRFMNSTISIVNCHKTCQTCNTTGNQLTHNCMSCIDNHYPLNNDHSQCFQGEIDHHYLDNDIYKPCYYTCKTCHDKGDDINHNCISCLDHFIKNKDNKKQCIPLCDGKLWHYDKTTNKKTCIKEDECPLYNPYLIEETKECVSSCMSFIDHYCITCRLKRLFIYEYKCVINCPIYYVANYEKYICIPMLVKTERHIKQFIVKHKPKVYFNDFSLTKETIDFYLETVNDLQAPYQGELIDLIYLIIGEDYSMIYFLLSDLEIYEKVYDQYDITEIDFRVIKKALPKGKDHTILVIQWDIYRKDEYSNQTEYLLYDIEQKKFFDITHMEDKFVILSSPLRNQSSTFIQIASHLLARGINVYDYSSSFFNDICYKFKAEGIDSDITVIDRRKYYYPPFELCGINCTFISFDDSESRVLCQCSFQSEFHQQILSNPKSKLFKKKNLATYNSLSFKCQREVYNSINNNYAFFSFIITFMIIIFFDLLFREKGLELCKRYINGLFYKYHISTTHQTSMNDLQFKTINPLQKTPTYKDNNAKNKDQLNQKVLQVDIETRNMSNNLRKTLVKITEENTVRETEKDPKGTQYNPNCGKQEMTDGQKQQKKNDKFNNRDKGNLIAEENEPDINFDYPKTKIQENSIDLNNHDHSRSFNISSSRSKIQQHKITLPINQTSPTVYLSNDKTDSQTNSFFLDYLQDLKRHEILIVSIYHVPYFISIPTLCFHLTLMFTIQSLLFTNDYIHNIYLQQGIITVNFWFRNEFKRAVYAALIGIIYQVIIIKVLLILIFNLQRDRIEKDKYNQILEQIRFRSSLLFTTIKIIMIVLLYINTSYCGIFEQSQYLLFIGYCVSLILSFLIALLLCFLINIVRFIGVIFNKM